MDSWANWFTPTAEDPGGWIPGLPDPGDLGDWLGSTQIYQDLRDLGKQGMEQGSTLALVSTIAVVVGVAYVAGPLMRDLAREAGRTLRKVL